MNFLLSLLIIAAIWCLIFWFDVWRERDKRKAKVVKFDDDQYNPQKDFV